MTPDEFESWQHSQPNFISKETRIITACVKDIADYIDFDIGNPIRSEPNGDAMWYVLTDGQNLLVVLCTPYAVLIESTIDDGEASYCVVTKPIDYLEHLANLGLRKLTPDEMEDFLQGVF